MKSLTEYAAELHKNRQTSSNKGGKCRFAISITTNIIHYYPVILSFDWAVSILYGDSYY